MAEEIDLSYCSDERLRQIVAVCAVMEKRASALGKAAKAGLLDRISPKEHPQAVVDGIVLGKLTRTKGGAQGKYKVKDPVVFGAWLAEHGYDDYYETMPVAVEDATKPDWLRNLVERDLKGEIPDGVDFTPPSAPQVRFTLDVEQAERLFDANPSSMTRLLESPDDRGATVDDSPQDRLGL